METTNEMQEVLRAIENIDEESKFYAQMKNALRIYYLGINNVFIVNRILKNTDLSSLGISEQEKTHVENAGWLLDQNYVGDVYLGVLKTNLILDAWLVFKSNSKLKPSEYSIFLKWYETLVNSLDNDSMGTDSIEDDEGKLKIVEGEKIDFITPEVVLSLVNKLVGIYKN